MNKAFFIPLLFGAAGLQADLPASGYYRLPDLGVVIAATLVISVPITYYAGRSITRPKDQDAKWVAVILGGRAQLAS
jgi:Kef-type K+ transport system membrane component KefB